MRRSNVDCAASLAPLIMDLHTTISAAAAGDDAALNLLFERNLPLLEAFLRVRAGRALKARESIRDLAQSVCREVLGDWEKIELRSEKEFRNYLFLEAGRKILKKARFHGQERRDARLEVGSLDTDEAETLRGVYASMMTPSRCADAREEVATIEDAIAELPEAQRDAITLTRLMGLSSAEVATELGVTESAVRGLIARGLARIAAQRSSQRGEN